MLLDASFEELGDRIIRNFRCLLAHRFGSARDIEVEEDPEKDHATSQVVDDARRLQLRLFREDHRAERVSLREGVACEDELDIIGAP